MADVIAHVISVSQSQNHEIMTVTMTERPGCRCLRLFMLGFSMNDGSNVFRSVLSHSLPDAHYVPAVCIYDLATALVNLLQGVQISAKGRHDDDILRRQILDLRLTVLADKVLNPHGRDLIIHQRIMNNLAQNEESLVFEDLVRGVGQIDRPFHAIAETELLRQQNGRVPDLQNPAVEPNPLNNSAT